MATFITEEYAGIYFIYEYSDSKTKEAVREDF